MPKKKTAQKFIGIFAAFALAALVSCSQEKNYLNIRGAGASAADEATLIDSLVTGTDEHGNPTGVVGYTENTEVKEGEVIPTESFIAEDTKDEPVFDFKAPEGYDTGFSQPVSIGGSYLGDSAGYKECENLSYSAKIPILADVLSFMKEKNLCSHISFNYCVKLEHKDKNKKVSFIRTPPVKINLICAVDSFAGLKIAIENDAASTYKETADIHITASASVAEMFLTNSPDCSEGGVWEKINAKKTAWALSLLSAEASVYGKFRDVVGNESACMQDSITRLTPTAPTALNIAPAAFSEDTASVITLSYTDADGDQATSCTLSSLNQVSVTSACSCSAGICTVGVTGAANFNGSASFAYTVTANDQSSDVATASLTITPVDDTPVAAAISPAAFYFTKEESITLSYSDAEDDQATSCAVASLSQVTESSPCSCAAGVCTVGITGVGSYVGPASFTYTVTTNGLTSSAATASFTIKSAAIVVGATAYTNSATATLTLTAAGSNQMYITNTAGCTSGGAWEAYATAKENWALVLNTTNTVYATFVDSSGNASPCVSGSIIHDNTAPTGGSISVDAGAAYTRAASVSLGLTASGASQMYITNTAACTAGGSWESYATTKNGWSPSPLNATTTVYVKYRDEALNETSCYSDALVHDDTPPSAPGSFIDGDYTLSSANAPAFSWAAASDGGSGLAKYEVAIGTTAGGNETMDWTDVGTATSLNPSSLSLALNTTYYGSVRAVDAAGNTSVTTGDGFTYKYWRQQAFIKPSNNAAGLGFGTALSLSGDRLAVGSWQDDSSQTTISNGTIAGTDTGAPDSGAAYIFKRTATSWSQEAFIKAANAETNDYFGTDAILSGDTLAVAAYEEDGDESTIINGTTTSTNNDNVGAGAVYVYRHSGTTWGQEAYLKAANSPTASSFGYSLGLSNDTIVVGTWGDSSNQTTITNGTTASADTSSATTGAAYVYRRSGTVWSQEAYIKAVNADASDNFGRVVAIDGDTIAVHSRYEDSNETTITNGTTASTDNSASQAGAVYVYRRTGTLWAQEAYVKASNTIAGITHGTVISISMDTLVVGNGNESSNQTTITNGTGASTDTSVNYSGSVYVYKRTGATWVQEAYIKAANAGIWANFGYAVSIAADTLAVGAYGETSNATTITNGTGTSTNTSLSNVGAVYIYKRNAATWGQEAYIKAANSGAEDHFGITASLSSDTLAVGAYRESSSQTTIINGTGVNTDDSAVDSGAIYIYTR